jgi:hypothetical protein
MNLALNAGEEAKRHGHSAELVRAMIDPAESVNAWRDPNGTVYISQWMPDGIPQEDFILQHLSGSVLTLSGRQAVDLGFARAYEGNPAGLGRMLGLWDWTSQGDEGRKAMTEATRSEEKYRAAVQNDREKFLIEQNHRRREAAKATIESFLKLATEWNPKLETYSTYRDWGWYWNGWEHESNRLTPESRLKWRDRTDITVAALQKAHGGVREMMSLEKEAKALGQAPLFAEGTLEAMRLDLEVKMNLLLRGREKWFKDNSR